MRKFIHSQTLIHSHTYRFRPVLPDGGTSTVNPWRESMGHKPVTRTGNYQSLSEADKPEPETPITIRWMHTSGGLGGGGGVAATNSSGPW